MEVVHLFTYINTKSSSHDEKDDELFAEYKRIIICYRIDIHAILRYYTLEIEFIFIWIRGSILPF